MTEVIKIKVIRKPVVKTRVNPRFPASVKVAEFLTLASANGTYTFGVDYTQLDPSPLSGLSTSFIAVYDATAGVYRQAPIASLGSALTKTDDTNVTLTLGGSPAGALLAATSITVGWTGALAASRGGFGADVSAQSGVPLFAAGVPNFTGTTGSGNFVRATSPTLVTPALGTPASGTLTNCTGLPLTGLVAEAAYTLVGNVTGSSAAPTAFTIDGLTLKGTPASTDELLIWDAAGAAIKKATVSSIAASAGVSSFNTRTGAVVPASGDYTYSANTVALPTKYWSGGQHSNDVGTPNTKVDIAAGSWRDSTDAFNIVGTSKIIDFTIVGANGLDAGTIAASTRYYTFAIAKSDGTYATLASISPTAPTLPTGYTYFRRIGMVKTDGSAHILPFTHVNNGWYYSAAQRDVSSVSFLANTVTTRLLPSVPTVQGVTAIFSPTIIPASGTSILADVFPAFLPDTANTGWRLDFEGMTATQFAMRIPVDSSGQIKYRAGTVNHTVTIDVAGWIDDL